MVFVAFCQPESSASPWPPVVIISTRPCPISWLSDSVTKLTCSPLPVWYDSCFPLTLTTLPAPPHLPLASSVSHFLSGPGPLAMSHHPRHHGYPSVSPLCRLPLHLVALPLSRSICTLPTGQSRANPPRLANQAPNRPPAGLATARRPLLCSGPLNCCLCNQLLPGQVPVPVPGPQSHVPVPGPSTRRFFRLVRGSSWLLGNHRDQLLALFGSCLVRAIAGAPSLLLMLMASVAPSPPFAPALHLLLPHCCSGLCPSAPSF